MDQLSARAAEFRERLHQLLDDSLADGGLTRGDALDALLEAMRMLREDMTEGRGYGD
jgi:hypothetical protein